jgi:Dehydroquinase class II
MPRILVIHGAGMNMRGKVQVDIFGPMTLPEYDERIRGYAKEVDVDVEIFHSNIEGEIVNRLYTANDQGFDAAIFNPSGIRHRVSGTGGRPLASEVPDHRSAHLESDPSRACVADRRREPGRRRRIRRCRVCAGAARDP